MANDLLEQEVSEERKVFYEGLRWELVVDRQDVEDPWPILIQAMDLGVISELGLWEYHLLDEDGGTTEIQRLLNKGSNIFFRHLDPCVWERHCQPAFEKYGHLVPPESDLLQGIERAKAAAEEWKRQDLEREQLRDEDSNSVSHLSTTSSHSTDSDVSWHTVTAAFETTDQPPTTSTSTDPLLSIDPPVSSGHSNGVVTSGTQSPHSIDLSAAPSAEQQLAAENTALKKRIAELELAGEARRRQK